MNRTPKDYTSAKRIYQGRLDKVLGRKIRTNGWMKYDDKRDCFVLSEVMTCYKRLSDGKYQRCSDKNEWVMKPYAEIYPDRVVILHNVRNNYIDSLNVVHTCPTSNKFSGRTWRLFERKGYSYHTLHEVTGDAPIVLKDGKLAVLGGIKQRVVDNELRKEMNRMIQKIRHLLTVRAKLGAFDKVTHSILTVHANKHGYASKWKILNAPKEFLKLLQAVVETDIETFYPILWLADCQWYYHSPEQGITAQRNIVEMYNKLIDAMRERIRRELGVVEYVEVAKAADERSADRQDGEVDGDVSPQDCTTDQEVIDAIGR